MVQVTNVEESSLSGAITPTLRIDVAVFNETSNQYDIIRGEGEILTMEGGRISALEYVPGPIQLQPNQPQTVSFSSELSRQKLNRLEEIRKGGDFTYRLRGFLTVYNRSSAGYESLPIPVQDTQTRISQSDWANMLREFGHRDLRIVEVSFPVGPERATYEGAHEHHERALNHYHNGVWKSAIASARDVIETFLSGDTKTLEEALGEQKWTRVKEVFAKAKHFMAPGAHTAEEIPYTGLTRHDAEVSILFAQAALKYFSESVVARGGT